MGRRQRGRPAQGPEGQAAGARHHDHQRHPVAAFGCQLGARGSQPRHRPPCCTEALQVHNADGSGGAAFPFRLAVARHHREHARRGRVQPALLLPVLRDGGPAATGRVARSRPARVHNPQQARRAQQRGHCDVWHSHPAPAPLLRCQHLVHAGAHHVFVLFHLFSPSHAVLGARRGLLGHLSLDRHLQDVRARQAAARWLVHAVRPLRAGVHAPVLADRVRGDAGVLCHGRSRVGVVDVLAGRRDGADLHPGGVVLVPARHRLDRVERALRGAVVAFLAAASPGGPGQRGPRPDAGQRVGRRLLRRRARLQRPRAALLRPGGVAASPAAEHRRRRAGRAGASFLSDQRALGP
mmetsp:Transcript_22416/g.59732  ORF Transcript_22416/g.59732 Transcript_22416/m.59732 type:complete len:352 (-) Transcript_22416:95-1150(-)